MWRAVKRATEEGGVEKKGLLREKNGGGKKEQQMLRLGWKVQLQESFRSSVLARRPSAGAASTSEPSDSLTLRG